MKIHEIKCIEDVAEWLRQFKPEHRFVAVKILSQENPMYWNEKPHCVVGYCSTDAFICTEKGILNANTLIFAEWRDKCNLYDFMGTVVRVFAESYCKHLKYDDPDDEVFACKLAYDLAINFSQQLKKSTKLSVLYDDDEQYGKYDDMLGNEYTEYPIIVIPGECCFYYDDNGMPEQVEKYDKY